MQISRSIGSNGHTIDQNNLKSQSKIRPIIIDREFIKQLTEEVTATATEQVMQRLQAAGATPIRSAPPPPAIFPRPPPSSSSQELRSPTQGLVDSITRKCTPRTPDCTRGWRDEEQDPPSSPDRQLPSAGSGFSRASRGSARRRERYKTAETLKVSRTDANEGRRRSSYTNNKRSGTGTGSSQGDEFDVTTDIEETPLEKSWQPLFDNGNPTLRLGQFLRGIALHLIDDYEPKNSIVVTPAKMLRFLNETKIPEEQYPWDIIFGNKLSCASISAMFQKLLCQHHLVQERHDRPPTVPGLTPYGFDQFLSCLIQAHPESGYERVAKAVMNMPISNADNKSERFPKELSKRLFLTKPNTQAQQKLTSSLSHKPYVIHLLKGASRMPPPSPLPKSTPPNSQSSLVSNAADDEELPGHPPVQIERERKPYTAKEGTGKYYSDSASYKPEPPPFSIRTSQTNSRMPSQAMYNDRGLTNPTNILRRNPHQRSAAESNMLPQTGNTGNWRSTKQPLPPIQNRNGQIERESVARTRSVQFGSNLHPAQSRGQYPVDADEEATKRYRSRSRVDRSSAGNRNQPDDDPRRYPNPRRSVPIANGYKDGPSQGGGPPIDELPAVGSSAVRNSKAPPF